MTTRLVPLTLVFGLALSPALCHAASFALVRHGQPAATLVVASQPTRSAQFAARELQYHVKLITGATLPLVTDETPVTGTRVLIGESRATRALGLPGNPFTDEEYLIRFFPDTLVLMGKDDPDYGTVTYDLEAVTDVNTWPQPFTQHATCFAVYDVLERCGVRWFSADDVGLDYPRQDTLTVTGWEVRRYPAFRYREPGYTNGNGYDNYTRMWQYSGFGGRPKPEESSRLAQVEAMAWSDLHRRFPNIHQYNQAKRARTILFVLRSRAGGEPYSCGHSFYGYYQRFWEKNPKNEAVWEGEHKDWFAQGYSGQPPQMCYTNPGLVAQTIQDAHDYFDGKPAKFMSANAGDYFGIAAMDNRSWCQCPDCQALLNPEEAEYRGFSDRVASDYLYNLANLVARDIAQHYPDKFISTIAYASTAFPPKHREVEPNVSVQLCLHTRNWYSEAMKQNDLDMLRAWTADKNRRVFLWMYWCFPRLAARGGNWRAFPGFFAHMAADQYKLFHEAGIRGCFYEWFGQHTDAYVGLKMMDDPLQDVDKLLDDYFTRYYGPAAQPMKDFYLTVEERYSNPAHYPEGVSGHQTNEIAWGWLGTKPVMTQLHRLMTRATHLATQEPYKSRVAVFRADIWDYMKQGRRLYEEVAAVPIPTLTVKKIPPASGDPAKVAWDQLEAIPVNRQCGTGQPTDYQVSMRLAHDGEYYYCQFTDLVNPQQLQLGTPMAGDADGWELFWMRDRTAGYRQVGFNLAGEFVSLAYGEDTKTFDAGVKIVSDTSAPDRWVVTLVCRLDQMFPGGVKSGDTLYGNFYRSTLASGKMEWLAWSPTFALYHLPARFGEMIFE